MLIVTVAIYLPFATCFEHIVVNDDLIIHYHNVILITKPLILIDDKCTVCLYDFLAVNREQSV